MEKIMNNFRIKALLILMTVLSIVVISCDDSTTDPVTDTPTINSISYNAGYVGMELTINGANFGEDTDPGTVQFGGVDAPDANYTSWTPTQIKVVIPVGAKSGKVVVINDGVSSNGVDFQIIAATPAQPTDVFATSLSSTSVRIKWEADSTAQYTLYAAYLIKVYDEAMAQVGSSVTIDKATKQYDVTGLTEGTEYTFKVYGKYATGVESTTPAEVIWSPATRFNELAGSTIRVYETASSKGSGLDLYDATTQKPQILTVNSGSMWNLGLDTRTSNKVFFGPARSIDYNYTGTPALTEIGQDILFYSNSLDEALDNVPMNSGVDYSAALIDLNTLNLNGKNAVVFLIRTAPTSGDWNYAKVMVKKTGGNWLQGTAPDRYIEVEISFQKIINVPYARTAGQ
jgi:hypothetical protein